VKHLLLDVRLEGDGASASRRYLLEGDRRQTPERMIQRAASMILGDVLDGDVEDGRFRGPGGRGMTLEEHRAVTAERAGALKSQHVTLVVRENVTENACRVGYSGPYSGRG